MELGNVFTSGSRAMMVGQNLVAVPVNEDWAFVGIVKTFAEGTQKVTVEKIWDQAGTKTTFYAYARHPGSDEDVETDKVVAGQPVLVMRVGVGNNDFADTSQFQGPDSDDTTHPSFVCFFF